MRRPHFTLLLGLTATLGCGSSPAPEPVQDEPAKPRVTPPTKADGRGRGGRGTVIDPDTPPPPRGLVERLERLDEPVAHWLLSEGIGDDGIVDADYMTVLKEVGAEMGCAPDGIRTFVISDTLVQEPAFPRLVSTVCSGDFKKNSRFFLAASFADKNNPDDIDARNLEMFVWDETDKRYVFYAMLPVEDSERQVQVELSPVQCRNCHLTPSSLDSQFMPMLPIMNELVTPWPHWWNGGPGSKSHSFTIPDLENAPNIVKAIGGGDMTADNVGTFLAPASELQFLIERATDRAAAQRANTLRSPADLDRAVSLLRPLFCEEQVNFVTEDDFGLPVDTLIALRTVFGQAKALLNGISWTWLDSEMLSFANNLSRLQLIPVRGYADKQMERQLKAKRGLRVEQIMRVRAVDWTTPVFSSTRCDLWKNARGKIASGQFVMELEGATENRDLVPKVLDKILRDADLLPENDANIVVVTGEKREEMSLVAFGDLVRDHVDNAEATGHGALARIASDRLCVVEEHVPSQPALPPGACGGLMAAAQAAPAEVARAATPALPIAEAVREPAPIPDGDESGLASKLTVELEGDAERTPAATIMVRVSIKHPWRGHLTIKLRSPDGTEYYLRSYEKDDSADNVEEKFIVALGEGQTVPAGEWELLVIDSVAGEQGTLERWSMGVNASAPTLFPEGMRPTRAQR